MMLPGNKGVEVSKVKYWLMEEAQQNFGDYLTEFLMQELFYDLRADDCDIRLIGSCIHDSFIPGGYDPEDSAAKPTVVFWGCGIREPGGLSEAARKRADIRGVRGPISSDELRLGGEVPSCDPGLLLPALHKPRHRSAFAGKTVCIPHFHDPRTDRQLLAASGADIVLRPNISLGINHLLQFVDALTSADFVLTASLHGAIIAAAYQCEFAYWQSATVDLPLKWDDFSRSAGIETAFADTVKAGRKIHAETIMGRIVLPCTLPLLAAAPFPLKANGLAAVLRYELGRVDAGERGALLDRFADAVAGYQPDIDRLMAQSAEVIRRYRGGDEDAWARSDVTVDQMLAFAVRTLDAPMEGKDPALREDKVAALIAVAQDSRAALERQIAETGRQAAEIERQAALSEQQAAEIARQVADGERKAARIDEQAAEIKETSGRLEKAVAAAREAAADAQERETARQAEIDRHVDRIADLVHARDQIDGEMHAVRANLFEAERTSDAQRSDLDTLWHSNSALSDRLDAAHRDHASLLDERNQLARDRDAARENEQAAAAAAASRLQAHKLALRQERQHSRARLRGFRDAVSAALLARRQEGDETDRKHATTSGFPGEDGSAAKTAVERAIGLIAASGLFNAGWYASQIEDPADDADALLRHYVTAGGSTGSSPHPLFDAAYYVHEHPEVAAFDGPPLQHYLELGWLSGWQPHPLFDPEYYFDQAPEAAFAGTPPLVDYLARGSREGLRPNPLFDSAFYLNRNEDVRAEDIEPLTHYAGFGWRERRDPHPLIDIALYLNQNDDLVAADVDPLAHYFKHGQYEDHRRLVILFDAAYYREQRGSLLADDMDPLADYIQDGWKEGVPPHPLFDVRFYREDYMGAEGGATDPLTYFMTVGRSLQHTASPLFDPGFYLANSPDVAASGDNAFLHYVATGGAEQRAPNPVFHSTGYAFDHPDVADYDGNPLIHYLLRGREAGHLPHPLFDPSFYAAHNADVRESRLDLYEHYVRHGRAEGRQASRILVPGRAPNETAIAFPDVSDWDVTVIIPVYRSFGDTFRCLYSISETLSPGVSPRIVLADDCPDRPVARFFADIPNLGIIANAVNHGFLRNCNNAAAATSGEFIVFLNNDTVVSAGWLESMVDLARRDERNALVGCKLLNADGTIQEAGGIMFTDGWGYPYGRNDRADRPEYNFVREVDCVIGACFLVRRSVFDEVGGFDDRYYPAFFEEFDLAMAIVDAGYKVLYQPASEVIHLGSASYGTEVRDRQSLINQAQFKTKWAHRLAAQYQGPQDLFLARDRRHRSGTILIVDDVVPEFDKHAGALTMFQYMKLMVELDFKVVYVSHYRTASEPYTSIYQQMGIEILHGDIDIAGWMRSFGRYLDWVWLARPDVAINYIDAVRANTDARLLYYTHDLHFLREQRRHEVDGDSWALSESVRLLPIESAIFRQVDCVMTPSSQEAVIIGELAPGAAIAVLTPYFFNAPALVSTAGSRPLRERREIIFVGGYRHVPNVDAAIRLVHAIMPKVWQAIPDAKVLLVGSNPPQDVIDLASARVEVVGFVEDLAPWYARARMSVSPLRYGAGVKGKIVGSLEAGVPVVTTTIGNEGLGLQHGIEAIIGDTDDELSTSIVRLFKDDALLDALNLAGSAVIHERFSEEGARDHLLDALGMSLCNVCGTRQRPRTPYPATGNWREEPACLACWSLNRMALLADVILKPYRFHGVSSITDALPFLKDLRIHEFGFVGAIHDIMKSLPHFSSSDFFDDVPPGERAPNGVMCQDLQNLTFGSDEIDLCISQDVFEHIPDPWAAFGEIYRVLKHRGRHIFTIPYSAGAGRSVVRATLGEQGLQHILPPEYHGDPIRDAGALVFTDFGRDIFARLEAIGFRIELTEVHHGGGGGYSVVFSTQKIDTMIEGRTHAPMSDHKHHPVDATAHVATPTQPGES